jgi:hypothetical protein
VQGADGDFKDRVLTDERRKIDVGILGEDQARVGDGPFVERVQLGERPVKILNEFRQTTDANKHRICREIRLEDQSLRGFSDVCNPREVVHFQVIAKGNLCKFKREIMVIADFFMDDEANIYSEGFFRTGHEMFYRSSSRRRCEAARDIETNGF